MADGTRYTDVYTASIDSITRDGNTLTIKYGVSDPDVVDNPLLALSFYGWDSKHFIVPAHTRAPCSDGSQCRFEYRPADGDSNPIFTQTANSVAGAWGVIVDLTAWNGDPDSVPDLIAANDVQRVEVSVIPTATIDGVGLGLNAVSKTFDLAAEAVGADWFKLDKAVVNVDGCNACHDKLGQTFHGSFGVGGVEGDMLACKHCHNPTYGGSHLELASRSIDNYVHAIHSFQDFDPGDIFEAPFDPVFARRYSLHIEHTFPNFTIKNCEACHTEASLANAATYNVPDQSKSLPSLHRGSDDLETAGTSTPMATWYELVDAVNFPVTIAEERPLSDRNVGNIKSFVAGPASRSCGGCHRAEFINEDDAGGLASWNAHTEAFGTYAVIEDNGDENKILFGIIDKIMTMFE